MNDLKGIIEDCNKSDLVSDRVIKKVIEIIGQEEWQILHDENNDICTTMGELIITLEEIAKLKSIVQNTKAVDESFAKLQQENAELKARVEKQNADILFLKHLTEGQRLKIEALEGQTPWKEIKDKSEVIGQLTTAKEIIRDLLSRLYSVEYDRISDLERAEQFLKENE